MPKKPQIPQNKTVPLTSPLGGVVRSVAREQQPMGGQGEGGQPQEATCWNSLNYLPYDRYGRSRIGVRPPVVNLMNPQLGVNGSQAVQALAEVHDIQYAATVSATPNLISGPANAPSSLPGTFPEGNSTDSGFNGVFWLAFEVTLTAATINSGDAPAGIGQINLDISSWNTENFPSDLLTPALQLEVTQNITQSVVVGSQTGISFSGSPTLPTPANYTFTFNALNTGSGGLCTAHVTELGGVYTASSVSVLSGGSYTGGVFAATTSGSNSGTLAGFTMSSVAVSGVSINADNGTTPVVSISTTANPSIAYIALGFFGNPVNLNQVGYNVYGFSTKAALLNQMQSISQELNPQVDLDLTTSLGESNNLPPQIPVSNGSVTNPLGTGVAVVADVSYP